MPAPGPFGRAVSADVDLVLRTEVHSMPGVDLRSLPDDLRERYGVRPSPWYLRLGVVVAVGAVVVFLATYGARLLDAPVSSRLLTWQVTSPGEVEVVWEVSRDPGVTAVCVVRALDASKVDVGYVTVTVAPGATYVQPRYRMRTLAAAYAVELLGCGSGAAPRDVPGPQFPPGVVPPSQPPPGQAPPPA